MQYEGHTCRSFSEKLTYTLPVSVGCAYNHCKFCRLFKQLQYRLLPLDQIEAELHRVRDLGGNPETIFLGDGNAFGMETSRLLHILGMVRHYFPNCRTINMDATVTDIHEKTDDDLRRLYESGVRRLYLGIESGLDDVLAFMRKDHNTAEAYQQIRRMRDAGLVFCAHIMTGIAGRNRGLENAEALARFFNRTQPERIVNFSLFLHRSVPLYQDILEKRFIPADEVENLQEAYSLLEQLGPSPLSYDGFHDQVELRVRGNLPQDRHTMLERLKGATATYSRQEPIVAYVA